jgi:hypothetical protein
VDILFRSTNFVSDLANILTLLPSMRSLFGFLELLQIWQPTEQLIEDQAWNWQCMYLDMKRGGGF